MKNEMKTQSTIDYRYSNGIIGQYKGQDVYVLPESDYTPARKQEKDLIFALASGANKLKLVNRGMLIGYMDPQGNVELLRKSEFYPKPQLQAEEKPEAANTSASGINPIDEYLAGETLVDRFLREMKF